MTPTLLTDTFSRYRVASGWETTEMSVITEAAIDLHINGEPWLSFTCTPAELKELAIGFMYNEDLIQSPEEVGSIDLRGGGSVIDVWLYRTVDRPTLWQRTSGCAGGMTTTPTASPEPVPTGGKRVAPSAVLSAMDQLLDEQTLYREAGGVHSSALSDGVKLLARVEDIGRHNTLDKLSGRMLLENLRPDPMIVLTTGRVSSEMLQKSARMGASVVVSRTSATSESVARAAALGVTLVGYARKIGFLAYTHPDRLGMTG